MQAAFLVFSLIFVYIGCVVGDVKVLWPGANDTLHGTGFVSVIITESGKEPLISDLEYMDLSLCSGSNLAPVNIPLSLSSMPHTNSN